jgi:hypothetical protein
MFTVQRSLGSIFTVFLGGNMAVKNQCDCNFCHKLQFETKVQLYSAKN